MDLPSKTDETVCNNCDKRILENNKITHRIYCQKNIRKCPECLVPMNVHDMQQHVKETHSHVECKFCEARLPKGDLKDHEQKTCSERPIICSFCQNSISFKQYFDHQNQCGNRTAVCERCSKRIPLRNNQIHDYLCKVNDKKVQKKPQANRKDGIETPKSRSLSGEFEYDQNDEQLSLAVAMSIQEILNGKNAK